MTDLHLTPEIEDELDRDSELPPLPTLEDEAKVDDYLHAYRYYAEQMADANRLAQAEMDRVKVWHEKQINRNQGAIDYLTSRLKQFSEFVGRKKRTSPNGVLSWRKGREHVVVADDLAFCECHFDSDLVRVKATPDLTAITAQVKKTGEMPEGADLVRGDDTFKVETPTQ